MIIVISENLPQRVKGILCIWLLEVKTGIFVGNLNSKIEDRILKFLNQYMKSNSDILIVRNNDKDTTQGFNIHYPYNSKNKLINISGLQLIQKPSEIP